MRRVCSRVGLHGFIVPMFGGAQSSGSLQHASLCVQAPPCLPVGRSVNGVFVRGVNPRTGSLCSLPSSRQAQVLAHAGPKHSSEPLPSWLWAVSPLKDYSSSACSLRRAEDEGLERREQEGYASNNKCLLSRRGHEGGVHLKKTFRELCFYSIQRLMIYHFKKMPCSL